MNCRKCGGPLQTGWRACPHCGMALEQPVPASPPVDLMPPLSEDAATEVRYWLDQGKKINAIKVYRERTGIGLKEANDIVEALQLNRDLNPQVVRAAPPLADLVCPSCGGKHFESLSAIVKKGTRTSNTTSHGSAVGFGKHTTRARSSSRSSQTTSQTKLAETLAEPGPGCLGPFVGVLIVFGVGFLIFKGIVVGILLIALGFLFAKAGKGEFAKDDCRSAKWRSLFYCHRCDVVFDPQTGNFAPSDKMKSLLVFAPIATINGQ